MPHIRNAWYVAALPEELENGPLARIVVDLPLVLFRQSDGAVAVLLDICPHRFGGAGFA